MILVFIEESFVITERKHACLGPSTANQAADFLLSYAEVATASSPAQSHVASLPCVSCCLMDHGNQ